MVKKHRFKVDKLIRNKLPEIMRKFGIEVSERVMDRSEYIERLRDKLVEEVKEVIDAASPEELCEEFADLLEVMMALVQINNIDFKDIIQIADKKRAEKGSFDKRIYNDFVEIAADNPSIEYYRKRPNRYPEIK